MQFDNVGRKDLDLWHSIQKNFLHRKILKDTITFGIFNFEGKPEFMLTDFLLRIPQDAKSTPLESIILQAYSLIAHLTDDIKNKMPVVYDKNFSQTLLDAREDLCPIFNNDVDFVNEVILDGIRPNTEHITPAEIINGEIQHAMNDYFEI